MVQSASDDPVQMNRVWKEFLQDKVNSFIKWDLVRFFHDNPHTRDTAHGIAHFIGRDAQTIEAELQGLVDAGVLSIQVMTDVQVYHLTDNQHIRDNISAFVTACHNREFRVQAIQYIINGMNISADREV